MKLPPQMHVFGPVYTTPKMQAKQREPANVHHYHQHEIDTSWKSDPRVTGDITDPVRPTLKEVL